MTDVELLRVQLRDTQRALVQATRLNVVLRDRLDRLIAEKLESRRRRKGGA